MIAVGTTVSDAGHPRPTDWSSRTSRALVNWALLLLALAVACALGEVLVRVADPQQLIIKRPDIWMPVDTLGWIHRPNVRTTINTGERIVHVVTDKNGFRIGRAGRTEGKKHILLLGDSFVEAFQVEYEQSLAGLLEARLAQHFGTPVTVVNTGVGGWDPPQYLLQARALVGRAFDLTVVSVYVGNDVVLRRRDWFPPRVPVEVHTFRWPTAFTWKGFVDADLYPINDFLEVHSELFIFLKTRLRTLLMGLGLSGTYFPEVLLRSEATSTRWDVTAGICQEIAALGGRRGLPTLFVLVPTPYQVDPVSFAQFLRGFHLDPSQVDLDQPSRLMQAALERQHLMVLDALPVFRIVQREGRQLYGSVDNHLSPAGHDVLERFIEATIVTLLQHGSASTRSPGGLSARSPHEAKSAQRF